MSSTGPGAVMLPPATLPPATPSRSPSRSSKRQRAGEGSFSLLSSIVGSTTSGFSAVVKRNILGIEEKCWQCGASPVQACHVIAKRDSSFKRLKAAGLITFDHLDVVENGISLCPSCHANFDNTNAPGFIFFPSDLDFFIGFEEQDFQRREREARMGRAVPTRVCPTAQEYKDHQVIMRIVDDHVYGGLYQRYMLHDYLPTILPHESLVKLPFSSWHGAPMAALRRTFQIYGDPLSSEIPEKQREKLRRLQDLYMRPAPIRSEHDVEDGIAAVDIADAATNVAHNEGPCDENAAAHASVTSARQERVGGRSNQANLGHEAAGLVRTRTGDSAIDVDTSISISSPCNPAPEPSQKRGRNLSNDLDGTRSRKKPLCLTPRQGVIPEPLWKWGPSSSSSNKAEWYPRMMAWRSAEDE